MNKGIEIRNRKLEKKRRKRSTVNPDQEELCRFVEIRWQKIERINGKYKRTGTEIGKGLQVRNKVYLLDGHYKFVNSDSVKITTIYNEVPDWASDALIKRYDEFQNI